MLLSFEYNQYTRELGILSISKKRTISTELVYHIY